VSEMLPEALRPTVNSKYRVDVNVGTAETPDWVQVRALNSVQPAVANTVQDATDYDSVGWGADAVTLRKWSLALVAMRKQATTGYDEGQEALREAAEALDLVHIRWYERDVIDGEAFEGHALVQWEPQGGTAEGLSTVNVTLLGQGARSAIANPHVSTNAPVVASASPASGPAAGGDLVVLTGSGFTGATAVTFDGSAAAQFEVVSSTKIAAETPGGVAGAADVVVTTPAGASAAAAVYTYV